MEIVHQPSQQNQSSRLIPKGLWGRFRGRAMVVIAVLCSPCCVALIMPILLSVLAGTPFALWIGSHTSWVYGGLTLISVASLLLGVHWLRRSHA